MTYRGLHDGYGTIETVPIHKVRADRAPGRAPDPVLDQIRAGS